MESSSELRMITLIFREVLKVMFLSLQSANGANP